MSTAAIDVKSSTRLTKGYLICLGATLCWAFTGIFIRYLTETFGLPALVLAFWRDVFVALGLIVVFTLIRRAALRLPSGQLVFLLFYGVVLAVFNTLWTFSVALNGAAVATVLAYSC
jgi:drug/metabolite transporter (DMT)-like permease